MVGRNRELFPLLQIISLFTYVQNEIIINNIGISADWTNGSSLQFYGIDYKYQWEPNNVFKQIGNQDASYHLPPNSRIIPSSESASNQSPSVVLNFSPLDDNSGAFEVLGLQNAKVVVLRTYRNSLIYAESSYIVAELGSSVTLKVVFKDPLKSMNKLYWRKDGIILPLWRSESHTLTSVSKEDDGVYQICTSQNQHSSRDLALIKLTVKSCPIPKCGEGCKRTCPNCYNGGVCGLNKACKCLCPAGFIGEYCETPCKRGYFGDECLFKTNQTIALAFRRVQLCVPFIGCHCLGYTQHYCEKPCPTGKFGKNCELKCHCRRNIFCDPITGKCPGKCAIGYTGPTCQNSLHTSIISVSNIKSNPGQATDFLCAIHPGMALSFDKESVLLYDPIGRSHAALQVTYADMNAADLSNLRDNYGDYLLVVNFTVKVPLPGKYCCEINNNHQKCSYASAYSLPKLKLAPKVKTVTKSSVSVSWDPWNRILDEGEGPVIAYLLYIVRNSVMEFVQTFPNSNNSISHQISGLQGYTVYYIKIKCVRPGQGGTGDFGEPARVITLCDVPLKTPVSVSVKHLNPYEVSIYYQLPESRWWRCDRLTKLHYKVNDTKKQSRNIVHGTKQTLDLRALSPFTIYSVILAFENNAGIGQFSPKLKFKTLPTAPSPVRQLQFGESLQRVTILWLPPLHWNGEPQNYRITINETQENCFNGHTIINKNVSLSDRHFSVGALKPHYEYLASVTAVASGFQSRPTILKYISKSTDGFRNPFVSVHLISRNADSLVIGWSVPTCESLAYKPVFLYQFSTNPKRLVNSQVFETSSDNVTFTELQAFTSYVIRVRVRVGKVLGNWTEIIHFITSEGKPSAPRRLSIICTGETFLRIYWFPPLKPNGRIMGYIIELWSNMQVKHLFRTIKGPFPEVGHIQFTIHELHPNLTYYLRICAFNFRGNGSWSDLILATTKNGECPSESTSSNWFIRNSLSVLGITSSAIIVLSMIFIVCIRKRQYIKHNTPPRSGNAPNSIWTEKTVSDSVIRTTYKQNPNMQTLLKPKSTETLVVRDYSQCHSKQIPPFPFQSLIGLKEECNEKDSCFSDESCNSIINPE